MRQTAGWLLAGLFWAVMAQGHAADRPPLPDPLTLEDALALAGIYQISREGEMQCCLITTEANDVMRPVHDRMPALIPQDAMQDWLHSEDTHVIDALMKPATDDSIIAVEVSNYANNARNEGEQCIKPR